MIKVNYKLIGEYDLSVFGDNHVHLDIEGFIDLLIEHKKNGADIVIISFKNTEGYLEPIKFYELLVNKY